MRCFTNYLKKVILRTRVTCNAFPPRHWQTRSVNRATGDGDSTWAERERERDRAERERRDESADSEREREREMDRDIERERERDREEERGGGRGSNTGHTPHLFPENNNNNTSGDVTMSSWSSFIFKSAGLFPRLIGFIRVCCDFC